MRRSHIPGQDQGSALQPAARCTRAANALPEFAGGHPALLQYTGVTCVRCACWRRALVKVMLLTPSQLDFGHFRPCGADSPGMASHSSATLFMMPLSMAAR